MPYMDGSIRWCRNSGVIPERVRVGSVPRKGSVVSKATVSGGHLPFADLGDSAGRVSA